jgi:hypothetical protein
VRVREAHALPYTDRVALQKRLDRIHARTDFTGLYNTTNNCVFFYLREIAQGAALDWEMTAVIREDGEATARHLDDLWVDRVCRALQMGRAPEKLKEQALRWAEQAEKTDEVLAKERRRSDTEKLAAETVRRVKNRHGMHSKYRPSALVDGLKTGA